MCGLPGIAALACHSCARSSGLGQGQQLAVLQACTLKQAGLQCQPAVPLYIALQNALADILRLRVCL